ETQHTRPLCSLPTTPTLIPKLALPAAAAAGQVSRSGRGRQRRVTAGQPVAGQATAAQSGALEGGGTAAASGVSSQGLGA
uniref:Uncharacterized protein n=1 Tax=Aegilops tauschii subsp. strangulata TaxID=200361 RepID=A0A453PMG1_AEGTS